MRRTSEKEIRAKVIVLDDEIGVIESLKVLLEREGFAVTGVTDYKNLLDKLQHNHYDILILDFLLDGQYHGDEVLGMVRAFSKIYTILLTGHKDLAPPIETIRKLDIQAYLEKSDKLENILIQVETGLKSMQYAKNLFFNYKFCDILVVLREHFGYSQEDVAKLIDVHRGTIIDYENGNSNPSYINLLRLADLFKVNLDVLSGRIIHK